MPQVKALWNQWKKIAHTIGVFQSRLILTLFYFVLLLPVGLVTSSFLDLLRIKRGKKSTWDEVSQPLQTLIQLQNQA